MTHPEKGGYAVMVTVSGLYCIAALPASSISTQKKQYSFLFDFL